MRILFRARLWILLERILSKPLLASFIVGISIVGVNATAQKYFEGKSYLVHLTYCWNVHPLLFFSKVGPPFIIPLLVTSVAKMIQAKASESYFMEDAIPAIFVALISEPEMHQLDRQIPSKINPSYENFFPVEVTEPILPERFWKEPSQRDIYFQELLKRKKVEGLEAEFVDESGHPWRGLIFTNCKPQKQDLKIQGMVFRLVPES